jgi:hypothetical protein
MSKVAAVSISALALAIVVVPPAVPGQADVKIRHRFFAVDSGKSQLIHVDEFDPKNDWDAKTPGGPRDLRLLEGGKLLLSHGKGYAEYDMKTGKELLMVKSHSGINAAIRLASGNTLLGGNSSQGITVYEVDPAGKELSKIVIPGKKDVHIMDRLQNGNLLLSHNDRKSWIIETDPAGKIIWEIEIPGPADDVKRLANGNTIAPTGDKNTIVELDRSGKIVLTLGGTKEHPKVGIKWLASVHPLKNGNIIATNWLGHGVGPVGPHLIEFDRTNKVVWSWTDHKRAQMIHNALILE